MAATEEGLRRQPRALLRQTEDLRVRSRNRLRIRCTAVAAAVVPAWRVVSAIAIVAARVGVIITRVTLIRVIHGSRVAEFVVAIGAIFAALVPVRLVVTAAVVAIAPSEIVRPPVVTVVVAVVAVRACAAWYYVVASRRCGRRLC
eukprot:6185491-Pleurochrysis_carterae.AAC.2